MCCACAGGSTFGAPVIEETVAGQCVDSNIDDDGNILSDNWGDGCIEYEGHSSWCGNFNNATFFSDEQCCFCGGGDSGSD